MSYRRGTYKRRRRSFRSRGGRRMRRAGFRM